MHKDSKFKRTELQRQYFRKDYATAEKYCTKEAVDILHRPTLAQRVAERVRKDREESNGKN